MKNVIEVYNSTVTKVEKVFVCYGHKTYRKFSKKRYNANSEEIIKGGVSSLWDRHDGSFEVCIGVKKWNDSLQLKGLIVHELSHAIDYIMRENDLTDTEYKAYSMQSMYQNVIPFIDDIISKQNTNKTKKVHKVKI